MPRKTYNFDLSLLGTESDYKLSKELDIPRNVLTGLRNRRKISAFKKNKSDIEKLKILTQYLEKNKYIGLKYLYKECGFSMIFEKIINLVTLKSIIEEFEIKVNKHSGTLLYNLKRSPRNKPIL